MRRNWAVAAAGVALTAGCSYGTAVENLSAACPLLRSPEATLYLGADVVASEQPLSADGSAFSCTFQRGEETVLALNVEVRPARGQTPVTVINSLSRRWTRGQASAVPGLGDAAFYYEMQRRRLSMLTVAKQAGSSIRVMTLTANQPFSPNRLGALATIAVQYL